MHTSLLTPGDILLSRVVEDTDGDVVRCRWANSSLNECGGVCNAFPFGTLDEVSSHVIVRKTKCQG